MLDSLIDGQNGEIASATQAAMIVDGLQTFYHLLTPIGIQKNPVDEIRTWQMKAFFRNGLALVIEQKFGLIAKQLGYFVFSGYHR
jgi:hypothetical protein